MVYIVELVLFKEFNVVYRRTCTVHKCLMVYIVEFVLFKGFNCCISSNLLLFIKV